MLPFVAGTHCDRIRSRRVSRSPRPSRVSIKGELTGLISDSDLSCDRPGRRPGAAARRRRGGPRLARNHLQLTRFRAANRPIGCQSEFRLGTRPPWKRRNQINWGDLMPTPDYVEHLSEPWFSLISLGLKTVEGRKNEGKFSDMEVGQIIQWFNDDFEHRAINTRIVSKQTYPTFEEYLVSEGLEKCLPGIPSISHGLSVYFKYFTKEDEATYGVVAIRLVAAV
jgi:ASC-1-like (ASCH) protein